MAKGNEIANTSINLIGIGTLITGDITSNGDLRIDGEIKGNIKIKGKLVVGATGKIDGNIECQNADFSGTINADTKVEELMNLQSTCKLIGDITIGKLSIEPGASFSGKCSMTNSAPKA